MRALQHRAHAWVTAAIVATVLLLPVLTLAPGLASSVSVLSTPLFAAPVSLPDSSGFGEPSIAAAPDGTLYVVAPGTATWRSDNHGASWTRQANTLGNAGDADVAVDANGVVYGSDLSNQEPVSVSTDKATSYAYVTATNPNQGDRQWIAAAGAGNVYAFVNHNGNAEFSVSHDQAHTFGSVSNAIVGMTDGGNLLAASSSDLYIAFVDATSVGVAVSHNGGASWTPRMAGPIGGASCTFPTVARDAAGTLYLAWCELIGSILPTTARIAVAVSKDDGATWSAPRVLSNDVNYNVFPWVVAGNAGRVFVTWYEGVPPGLLAGLPIRDPEFAFLVDWHVEVAWSLNGDQASPAWQREAVTGVSHTGPIAHELGGLLDFFEMVEQPGGNVAITYAGGNAVPPTDLSGNNPGTVASLFAVVQTGGSNLRTG